MAAHEPLLGVSSGKRASTITLAILAGITTLIALRASINVRRPADAWLLCRRSPHPTSCQAIVSEELAGARNPCAADAVSGVIQRSLRQVDEAIAAAASAAAGRSNDGRLRADLEDCLQLLELSRDRLRDAGSAVDHGGAASLEDAMTWLSAVLVNHVTCLDSVEGRAGTSDLAARLRALSDLASAALAALYSVAFDHPGLVTPVRDFPAWVTWADRRLLRASRMSGSAADVVVAQDGSGNYTTVQAAVTAAPSNSKSRYVIHVKQGVYEEVVRIPKQKTNLMLVGDGMNATTITGSLNVVDGSTTFNSATVAAVADGLILQDLAVENTAGAIKHQAVALRVGADRSVINRCRIDGYQDTLYAHSLRQFYRDSTISGTVDFIFGDAAVVFQNCTVVARLPLAEQQNTVTAQGRTDPNENTGTSLQGCHLIAGDDLVPPPYGVVPTFLGRPWKLYSRTVVMQSYIGGHVDPEGWLPWSGDFALTTLYYGEYMNAGPGAGTAARVNWTGFHVINDSTTASAFTVEALIQGDAWLQSTGVSYTLGL